VRALKDGEKGSPLCPFIYLAGVRYGSELGAACVSCNLAD